MPTGNSLSPKINRHFHGICRLIKEWREDNGEFDLTVKDVAREIESAYLNDYDIELVITENRNRAVDQSNRDVLACLDCVRAFYAPLGLNLPEIYEFSNDK